LLRSEFQIAAVEQACSTCYVPFRIASTFLCIVCFGLLCFLRRTLCCIGPNIALLCLEPFVSRATWLGLVESGCKLSSYGAPRGSSLASPYTDVAFNKYLTGHDTSFSGPVGACWSVSQPSVCHIHDVLDDRVDQNLPSYCLTKGTTGCTKMCTTDATSWTTR